MTRLQFFCDEYCERFTDCCAGYDQFCSQPNLFPLQDAMQHSFYVTPTTTGAQIQRYTKSLQANRYDSFTAKNLTSQFLTSTLQPFKSLVVIPSSADKTITSRQTRATITSGFLREERREVPDERWKCVQDGHANESVGIWMIAACPTNWPVAMTRKQCEQLYNLSVENFSNKIPVTDQQGNNYKNRHCAKCNLAKANEIDSFELNVACKVTPPKRYSRLEALQFLFKYCSKKIKWKPRDGKPRRYCKTIYSSCPKTSPYYQNCTNGSFRIVYNSAGKNFENLFCARCHKQKMSKLTCGPKSPFISGRDSFTGNFNVLLDVFDTSNHLVAVSCADGTVYDVHLEICRRGEAQMPQLASTDRYRVLLWMLSSKRVIRRIKKRNLLRPIASAFNIEAAKIVSL